jgi:hypothetical protein
VGVTTVSAPQNTQNLLFSSSVFPQRGQGRATDCVTYLVGSDGNGDVSPFALGVKDSPQFMQKRMPG